MIQGKKPKKTQKSAPKPVSAEVSAAKRTPPPTADSTPQTADSKPTAADSSYRSEGQRLLAAVSGSLAAIAAAVGCSSRQTVADWRSGKKAPAAVFRAKLYDAYEIPPEAWSRRPGAYDVKAASALQGDADSALQPAPTTLAACLALLESIQKERKAEGLLPADRVKLTDSETRVLALRFRLEKEQELLEDRIVREHPLWHRLKKCVIRSLAPYPDAARSVVAALSDLDEVSTCDPYAGAAAWQPPAATVTGIRVRIDGGRP